MATKPMPKAISTSKVDLNSLLGDFERDLKAYKRDNAKVNLIGLDDQAKKDEATKLKQFDKFETEAAEVSLYFIL